MEMTFCHHYFKYSVPLRDRENLVQIYSLQVNIQQYFDNSFLTITALEKKRKILIKTINKVYVCGKAFIPLFWNITVL